jgi:hypothetical protein
MSGQKPEQMSASVRFETKVADAEALLQQIRAGVETLQITVSENADTANVTAAKRGFQVSIQSLTSIVPRETADMQVATQSVPKAFETLLAALQGEKSTARVLTSQLSETDRQNVSADLDVELPRTQQQAFEALLSAQGDVFSRSVVRSNDTINTIDSKVRLRIRLINAEQLSPRETVVMGVEVKDADQARGALMTSVVSAGGRTVESNLSIDRNGQNVARVVVDVPLAKAGELLREIKGMGSVRAIEQSKNAQVPEGGLARARLDVTFGTPSALVEANQGLWSTIREGLKTSIAGLLWSLQLIVIGVCLIAPWVLGIWIGWKILKKRRAATVAS